MPLFGDRRRPSSCPQVAAGSFAEDRGIGFHVAVLVTDADNTDAGSDRSGSGAELGIGGQITFGDSVVHLGGGYIPGADQGYLLLGLDLPDLVKAVGATR